MKNNFLKRKKNTNFCNFTFFLQKNNCFFYRDYYAFFYPHRGVDNYSPQISLYGYLSDRVFFIWWF